MQMFSVLLAKNVRIYQQYTDGIVFDRALSADVTVHQKCLVHGAVRIVRGKCCSVLRSKEW